jgi:hypothetical protein
MNYGLSDDSGPFQWRFPLAFQLIYPIIVLACFPFVCDSPRWLIFQDREQDALAALGRLRGQSPESEELQYEYKSIWQSLQDERSDKAPAVDVLRFKDKTQNLKRLILSCGTQLMQQFSGMEDSICQKIYTY